MKEKVDEVHGMLAGTQFSVDYLLPRSEELLSHTQRQERAISHIHDDLKEKTSAIMKELDDVERELHVTKIGESMANYTNAAEADTPSLVPTPQPLQQRPPVAMQLIGKSNFSVFLTNSVPSM